MMEYRLNEAEPVAEMTVTQFCELVRSGKVPPTAFFRTPHSNGVWRTVDNFRPFHQASLVDHPVGDVLQEKLRIEAEEKRHRAQWDDWYHAYAFGSLIEDSYGLAAIKDIAAASSSIGAARLIVCPSFSPERFITLSFHPDGVTLDALCGRTSLWDTGNAEFFDAGDAFRKRVELAYDRLPPAFSSWETFESISGAVESCQTATLDGVCYRHRTAGSKNVADAIWWNPSPEEHAAQTRVIGAYQRLIAQAGVGKNLCEDQWRASVFSNWW